MSLTLWPEADVDPALAITAEMVDPRSARTDELPVTLVPIARPVTPPRVGSVRRQPRIPNRGWRRAINLAWGGGTSAVVAALVMLGAVTAVLLAEHGRLLLPTIAGLLL